MPTRARRQRTYDHRLKDLVRRTGDKSIAEKAGVPRSTVNGWLRGSATDVVSVRAVTMSEAELQAKMITLEKRIEILTAVMRLLLVLVRVAGLRLDCRRLPDGDDKVRVLRAVERASSAIALRSALAIIGLTPARYFAWKRKPHLCLLDDVPSCPKSSPSRLTAEEVKTMKEMATDPEYRHVPTSILAVLAQRMGKVCGNSTAADRTAHH